MYSNNNRDEKAEIVRQSCESFFMETVSNLCFWQPVLPDLDLINNLLNVVFTEQFDSTKEFSYKSEEKADQVPVIRSFLLQLLLEHK